MTALGVARVGITPPHPLPLAGFSVRQGVFQSVGSPLYLRVLVWSQRDNHPQLIVVTADLLWWGTDQLPRLQEQIAERWGVPAEAVLLHGSHTHSGPQTSTRFTPSLGVADPDYVAWLEAQVLRGIEQAITNLEPVTLARATGQCSLGINRRRVEHGVVVIGANPAGPTDPEVTVIRCQTAAGATKALLVHYTCHPVLSTDNVVSAEWPGVAMALLEAELEPGAVAAFLQGCCGDINPRLLYGLEQQPESRMGNSSKIQHVAEEFVAVVRGIVAGPVTPLAGGTLQAWQRTVKLPLQPLPTTAELAALQSAPEVDGEWSRLLLADPSRLTATVPCTLTLLQLAPDLALLGIDAEVVVAYGLLIRQWSAGRVLPLPYSNGMLGYIVTAAQLAEGGYEAAASTRYFGLPAPFDPALEGVFLAALHDILAAAGLSVARQQH